MISVSTLRTPATAEMDSLWKTWCNRSTVRNGVECFGAGGFRHERLAGVGVVCIHDSNVMFPAG